MQGLLNSLKRLKNWRKNGMYNSPRQKEFPLRNERVYLSLLIKKGVFLLNRGKFRGIRFIVKMRNKLSREFENYKTKKQPKLITI